jgi:hypothetical protein
MLLPINYFSLRRVVAIDIKEVDFSISNNPYVPGDSANSGAPLAVAV